MSLPLKKKKTFFLFVAVKKKILMTTKPRGGGKALVVGPLKKELFCGFPNYVAWIETLN